MPPLETDPDVMENMELNQLHSELLSHNISQGLNATAEQSTTLLPSIKAKLEQNIKIINKNKRKLYKSSSMPKYEINDFRAANKYIKERRIANGDYNDYTKLFVRRKVDPNMSPSEGISFWSGVARNTTMDTAMGNKSLLNRRSQNTSGLLKSSLITTFNNT